MSRQSSGENAIFSAHAAVYYYNETTRSWESVDGGASSVFIFNNPEIGTYRVIGLSGEKYVINSPIFKCMAYEKVSSLFIHWRDATTIYGLSFAVIEDCEEFFNTMNLCVNKLNNPNIVTEQKTSFSVPNRRPSSMYEAAQVEGLENSYNLLSRSETELNQRDRIVKEVYTTEDDYVEWLTKLVEQCYFPVSKGKYKNVFSDHERKMIYGNVEIVRSMNIKFRQDLLQRLQIWHPQQTIADVFIQMIPFFRVYKEYYTNYEAGVALIDKIAKRKDVASYLKHCENVADGHKLPHLLIKPVQRIPRYTLLLSELIKHSPQDHPDYEQLIKAREQMKELTMVANESVRETEQSKKFTNTLKDPKKYIGFDSIVAPHRTLIYECDVLIKMGDKEYSWMLIFSDMLVFASTSGKKRIVTEKLPLEYVWFEDLGSDKFRIVSPNQMYLVEPYPKKELDKTMCISSFEKTITTLLRYRGFDCNDNGLTRTFAADYNGGRYDGDWYMAKPSGRGRMQFASGNIFTGEFEAGRIVGTGKMTYVDSGSYYEGQWQADKPHGFGKLSCPGGVYEGQFAFGVKQGHGLMVWANGDEYDGDWAIDQMTGFGKLTSKTATYDGKWEASMFSGKGKLIWPGGEYDGDWVNDRKEGQGTHTLPNGDSYVGNWKDNQRNGFGTFKSADGNYVYEGEWDSDRMHGKGTLKCPKFTYNGYWKEDRKSGFGKLENIDGSSYEGNWADDRREGAGVWKCAGEEYDGYWHSDKRFGKGKLTLPDGSSYDGEWINNRKEGKGTFIWSDGTKYSGNWMSDKRHGKGVLNAADESYKYAGEWCNDYRHGKGLLSNYNGTHDGEWKDNRPHGPGKSTSKNGEILEGVWNNGLLDGEAVLTKSDGTTIQLFYRDCHREKPSADTLPPSLPAIKLIEP